MRPNPDARIGSMTVRHMLKAHVEARCQISLDDFAPLIRGHLVQHDITRHAGIVDEYNHRCAGVFRHGLYACSAGRVIGYVPFVDADADVGLSMEDLGSSIVAVVDGSHPTARSLRRCLAFRRSRSRLVPSTRFLRRKPCLRRPGPHPWLAEIYSSYCFDVCTRCGSAGSFRPRRSDSRGSRAPGRSGTSPRAAS